MISTDLDLAASHLNQGSLVAIPTETVYGLAANAFDPKAVEKIYQVKQRPQFNPLIVHIGHLSQLDTLSENLPAAAKKLVDTFWPGPLTIVIRKSSSVPEIVTAGKETVGIRMPDHSMTLALLRSLPFPLVAPSANLSGSVSPTRASHVEEQLGDQIAMVLDGGPCTKGIESTIVAISEKDATILRFGSLPKEDIENVLGFAVKTLTSNDVNPSAPGMLKSHYAPKTKVLVGNFADLTEKYSRYKLLYLAFGTNVPTGQANLQLSKSKDIREASKNLYDALRNADKLGVDFILVEPFENHGLGLALNDRITRAAH